MNALAPALAVLAGSAIAAPVPATAAAPPQGQAAQHLRIDLTSFRISPAQIVLVRGRTYSLDIRNDASSSHDFHSKDFFASAAIAPGDQTKVRNGEVELKGGRDAQVELTPQRAGTFEFHCGHPLHAVLGMRGMIHVVDR